MASNDLRCREDGQGWAGSRLPPFAAATPCDDAPEGLPCPPEARDAGRATGRKQAEGPGDASDQPKITMKPRECLRYRRCLSNDTFIIGEKI
jgi:hypothetical protein